MSKRPPIRRLSHGTGKTMVGDLLGVMYSKSHDDQVRIDAAVTLLVSVLLAHHEGDKEDVLKSMDNINRNVARLIDTSAFHFEVVH